MSENSSGNPTPEASKSPKTPKAPPSSAAGEPEASGEKKTNKKTTPREIPGNFPYTTSHGVLKQILSKVIEAERPAKFSGDFLSTVLGFTGGSAAVVPPILKRTGFLSPDATPTDQYNKFKSEGGRSAAALDALKAGYGEIFKRNEYAHKLSEEQLKDLLVSITGLNKTDGVLRAIAGTFLAIKSFIDPSKLNDVQGKEVPAEEQPSQSGSNNISAASVASSPAVGLVYNINIVLPSTDDTTILNAIFKSLRENLLR